jgi:hypothetical protein
LVSETREFICCSACNFEHFKSLLYCETVRNSVLKLLVSIALAGVLFGVLIPRILVQPAPPASIFRATGIAQTPPDAAKTSNASVSFGASGTRAEGLENLKPVNLERAIKNAPSVKKPQVVANKNAQVTPVNQLRALWVDAFGPGFKTPKEVDKLIADARALRLNALFVQVGRRMDCYCNLASVPRTADPKVTPGFDPLEDVIEKAHKFGIQVHAWMITKPCHEPAWFKSDGARLLVDHSSKR